MALEFHDLGHRQLLAILLLSAALLALGGVVLAIIQRTMVRPISELADSARAIEAGRFEWSEKLEDVHMNIEARLTQAIGDAGKRLHTGRSRNDQVATDLRLYVRDVIDELLVLIDRVESGLLDLAEEYVRELQRAQRYQRDVY